MAGARADVDAGRITGYLEERLEEMVGFIEQLALLESPTDRPETQRPVLDLLAESLAAAGLEPKHLTGRSSGGQLLARPADRTRSSRYQLILGHSDTVWPVGTLDSMPVELRNGMLHGPGVYDMKAGLAQAVFALQALRDCGVELRVAPVVFVNSDEEIGSPDSRRHIRQLSRSADRVLVMEPSLGPSGQLKTARKGGGRFTVRIIGRSAHAGLDPTAGASAIVELSHVIQSLHALNDLDRGISINVGTIAGGNRPNVVAATSEAEIDVRVKTLADAVEVESKIRALEPATPNVRLEIDGRMGRPPLERTPRNRVLWELARESARRLDVDLEEALAGGASDGNEASRFAPTLDGLGAVGDGAHAHHEHVRIDKLVERTALLALLLAAEPIGCVRG